MIRVTRKAEMTRMTGMKGMTTITWVTGMNINEITWDDLDGRNDLHD